MSANYLSSTIGSNRISSKPVQNRKEKNNSQSRPDLGCPDKLSGLLSFPSLLLFLSEVAVFGGGSQHGPLSITGFGLKCWIFRETYSLVSEYLNQLEALQ